MTRIKLLTHVLSILTVVSLLFVSAINFISVSAATITVTNTNDVGPGSLRQAILDANPGDTIVFASDLSGETIMYAYRYEIDKNLVIDASSLAIPITLDGDNNRIFVILTGITVTLNSLIIQNGYDINGGGIYNDLGSNLTVANCTLANNSSALRGGGIYNSGDLTVTDSTFSGNSAAHGGAIYNDENGYTTVTNSTFSSNTSDKGGGILNYQFGTLNISNSTFSNNIATLQGGGIFNFNLNANTVVTNSTFYGNSANSGGAMYNGFSLSVTNSTISGNSANVYGGGIYNDLNSDLTLVNSTLTSNSADKGDGIYNSEDGTLNYVNTMIANFMTGGDCVNDGDIGTNLKNLVEDGTCSPEFSGDPLLGPLANNGGQTQTHALLIGSPAIDTGDITACPATDQRGVPRPQGAGCDIGSYEYALFVYLPMLMK
jgi:predicted outer membrane repeat protein